MNHSTATTKRTRDRQPHREKPPSVEGPAITLTQREKEVLGWTARGK